VQATVARLYKNINYVATPGCALAILLLADGVRELRGYYASTYKEVE
jgi:hypothetical protein